MSSAPSQQQPLSPHLQEIWGFVRFKFLVLATDDFIVFIDDELDIDWKTRPEYDESNKDHRNNVSKILNQAAALEAADWDTSNVKKTIYFKRQIGEAIARAFEGRFDQAQEMLGFAETRRLEELERRIGAIHDHIKVKEQWLKCRKLWTALHYLIGILAIAFSSIAASKTDALGLSPTVVAWCAWLTVLCTALLTFLSAERKSNKYARAWSILNNQIARYKADYQIQLKDVLEAYTQGENIIFESDANAPRPRGGASK
jgi:hypothetical protein